MRLRILVFCSVFFLLSAPVVFAAIHASVDIKPSFKAGDRVSFDYGISSDSDADITYFVLVTCPFAPSSKPSLVKASAGPSSPIRKTFDYALVDESFEPQTCSAAVSVEGPEHVVASKKFEIIADPSFYFSVFECADAACGTREKFFLVGDSVFIDFNSAVPNPSVSASLELPDGSKKDISLPYSMNAELAGTYNIEASASKQGYKTTPAMSQFAVMKEKPVVTDAGACNANSVCDAGENAQNCPQDCSVKSDAPSAEIRDLFEQGKAPPELPQDLGSAAPASGGFFGFDPLPIIGVVAVLVLAVGGFLFWRKRKEELRLKGY